MSPKLADIAAASSTRNPIGPIPLEYQGAAVPKRMNKLGSAGAPGTGSFLTADPASEGKALTVLGEHRV